MQCSHGSQLALARNAVYNAIARILFPQNAVTASGMPLLCSPCKNCTLLNSRMDIDAAPSFPSDLACAFQKEFSGVPPSACSYAIQADRFQR
jgi:hypothetical protein